jgi:hypothetical protein
MNTYILLKHRIIPTCFGPQRAILREYWHISAASLTKWVTGSKIPHLTSGLMIYRPNYVSECRTRWPRDLRCGSAAARLLGFLVRIPPRAWMSVSCECCVLSGRGLCVRLITRPEESYQVWCVKWVRSRSPVRGGHDTESDTGIYTRSVRKVSDRIFLCEHLMDYNLARLHEPTLNLSAHAW